MLDHQPNVEIVTALDTLFERWNRVDQPGLVVGVQHRGQLVYRRAFGLASLETRQLNHIATIMRIGSTSKHFLALLMLLLEEEGLLDLDAPIGAYIAELEGHIAVPTLRQLLQHRGGTRCHVDMGFIGHAMAAPPEGSALAFLLMQRSRNFPPGTATLYSNGGYHLASIAASRVAGASLASLFQRYLFDPLEMHDTRLAPSDYVMIPGIASFHLPGEGQWRRGLFPSQEILGEGGIVSTVDDMLKWAAHLQTREIFGAQRVWDALLAAPTEIDGSHVYYALGLMLRTYRGVDTIRHSGSVTGGSSDLVCIPSEALNIVIMSNGAPNASPPLLTDQIVDIVLQGILDAPKPGPDQGRYREWLGHYGSPETGMVYSLESNDGALCLRIAEYVVPFPLALDTDGALTTGLNGNGPVRVYCEHGDDGTPALHVKFAGQMDICPRLVANGEAAFPAGSEGAFESPESGFEARIERSGSQARLHVRDMWGASQFDLLPLGGPWLSMRSTPHPDQVGATLWFPDGWHGGFMLNTARTRNLKFRRFMMRNEQ